MPDPRPFTIHVEFEDGTAAPVTVQATSQEQALAIANAGYPTAKSFSVIDEFIDGPATPPAAQQHDQGGTGGGETGTAVAVVVATPPAPVESTPPFQGAKGEALTPAAIDGFMRLASQVAATQFVPKDLRDKPGAVLACFLTGQELGIGPMTSLQHINIIDGRPSQSAELMRRLIIEAGHQFSYRERSNERCTVFGKRRDTGESLTVTWAEPDAKAAGLTNKQNWQKYARAMFDARATSELGRALFPDVLSGVSYTPYDLGAIDDETGNIVDDTIPVDTATGEDIANRCRVLPDEAKARMLEKFRGWGFSAKNTPRGRLDEVIGQLEVEEMANDAVAAEDVHTDTTRRGPTRTAEQVAADEAEGGGTKADDVKQTASTPAPPEPKPAEEEKAAGKGADNAAGVDEPEPRGSGDGDEAPVVDPPKDEKPKGNDPDRPASKAEKARLAVACNDIEDFGADRRHDLVWVISQGRTRTSTELTKREIEVAINVAKRIAAGDVGLAVEKAEGGEETLSLASFTEEGTKFLEAVKGLLGW